MFASGLPRPSTWLHISRTRKELLGSIFDGGLLWSKRLSAHTSCVNALAFSSKNGRLLATGGDDLTVQLWDFHQEAVNKPVASFTGHLANILALDFSTNNSGLFSAGNDGRIHVYDISRVDSPGLVSPYGSERTFYDTAGISAISCHPFQDEIVLSGGDSGCISIYDTRARPQNTIRGAIEPVQTLQNNSEVESVQFHPSDTNVFLSTDSRYGLTLRDIRMMSGAQGSTGGRSNNCIVRKYWTTLCNQHGDRVNTSVSSATFDRDGSKIATTMMKYFPTIYDTSDLVPLAVCTGENTPDGQSHNPDTGRTYANTCTSKHGSFGGPGLDRDKFYCAGSDDFRGYMWEIPDLDYLREKRTVMKTDRQHDSYEPTIGFTQGKHESAVYLPYRISTPVCRLTGHISIVNSALMHPHLPLIVTSGIEKTVIVHSPTESSPCFSELSPSPLRTRRLPEPGDPHMDIQLLSQLGNGDTNDGEMETLVMFDGLLRSDDSLDLFSFPGRGLDAYDSDDDSDVGSDEEAGGGAVRWGQPDFPPMTAADIWLQVEDSFDAGREV